MTSGKKKAYEEVVSLSVIMALHLTGFAYLKKGEDVGSMENMLCF